MYKKAYYQEECRDRVLVESGAGLKKLTQDNAIIVVREGSGWIQLRTYLVTLTGSGDKLRLSNIFSGSYRHNDMEPHQMVDCLFKERHGEKYDVYVCHTPKDLATLLETIDE